MSSSYEPYHVPQQSRRDKLRDQTSALYDPHLLPSDLLLSASSSNLIKQEGPNFTESYLDPQSSSIFNNSFLYDPQNLRALQQSSSSSSLNETLSMAHTSNCSVNRWQELSLTLSSQLQHQQVGRDFQVYGVGGGCGGPVANDLCISAVPLGPFTGYAAILKGSKFLRPAQQLLEELCQVGRWDMFALKNIGPVEDEPNFMDSPVEVSGGDPETKNSRLIIMLHEVYRRYKYYYREMQAVVASFESVPGLRDAAPFANFALKAMSTHFKSLKSSIIDQLQFVGKAHNFGKDATTKFGHIESHSQKVGNNSGFIEPVWRPQRGLPDRAVTVLRAWLFEHFLHPYPTDTDKQSLAKQTGLSRNQVSNWFINARVRLWKPMVEEIHMLETRDAQQALEGEEQHVEKTSGHLSGGTASVVPQNQATQTKRSQDLPSKRTRNEFAENGENQDMMSLPYGNMSHHQQFSVDTNNAGLIGLGGVSLTLGLHQNHGAQMSEPFPIKVARRFGLDEHSQGYIIGNSGVQNCQLGRDMVGARFLHDFVG